MSTPIKNSVFSRWLAMGLCAVIGVLSTSCQRAETFVSGQITESFVQDYNPKYLEVLWVVDDRSPMFNARTNIVTEATKFFSSIDSITMRYRMALVSTDMQFAKGALQPRGTRFVLDESYRQSATERAAVFSDLLGNLLNLKTGYQNRGLESAVAALEGEFLPQANVPLVLIFVSYAADESVLPVGETDSVAYFKNKFTSLKGGNAELVRTYAINYRDLPSGISVNSPEAAPHRCAQQYNNDIDLNPSTYVDNQGELVSSMGGYQANLCELSGFASQLNLNGLTLKTLLKSFVLKSTPNPNTLRVSITRKGAPVTIPPWSYNAPTNEIVFATAPAEGTSIVVQYLPSGK